MFLEISQNSQENTCAQSLFFNIVAGLAVSFFNKVANLRRLLLFFTFFFSKTVTSRSRGYICFAYINIFKVYAVFGAFASIRLKITFWEVWVNISFLDVICLYIQWVLTQLESVEKQILPLFDTEMCYEIATGIILVVRTQNFLKIPHVLPPDTHT